MSSLPTSMQQQPTQAQTREQIREQVRQSVQDAQREAKLKALRDLQGDLQTTTKVERVQAMGTATGGTGGGPGEITIHTGRGTRVDDIPPGAQELAIVFFVVMAVIIIGLPIARALGRLIDRRFAPSIIRGPDVEPQLRRIEQAVEAMSIEIERISESQRYLTKAEAARRDEAAILPRQP